MSATAVATDTSAEKPEFDVPGSVMAMVKSPFDVASAISAHVGAVESQPSSRAFADRTPKATGDVAIFSAPTSLSFAPMSSA